MTQLHSCTQTDSGIDCTACKLAQICQTKKQERYTTDDEYSISEQLSDSGNFSILYLVIAAAATLAAVLFFTWLFK